MKLSGLLITLFCSLLAAAQEVTVTPGKNGVLLSIPASKSYQLMASEEKQPTLSIQCSAKGNKSVHILMFSAGEAITENDAEMTPRSGQFVLMMKFGGTKQPTSWIPYGNPETFAYYGKTEAERVKFIQSLFTNPSAAIEFKPFLTGQTVTSVFNLTPLHDEMAKHPECSLQ